MKIAVNGDAREVPQDYTVARLVADMGTDVRGRGVAVAVNGDVIPRSEWGAATLNESDDVEVLNAVGGG